MLVIGTLVTRRDSSCLNETLSPYRRQTACERSRPLPHGLLCSKLVSLSETLQPFLISTE